MSYGSRRELAPQPPVREDSFGEGGVNVLADFIVQVN